MTLAFISGALMLGLFSIGIVFLRYWKETGERLFFYFAIAFLLMSVERVLLEVTDPMNEARSFVFFLRLGAFVLISAGIVDKNRKRSIR